MKNDSSIYLVDNTESKVVVWKDDNYFEKLDRGLKKREVETNAITERLSSIDNNLVLKHKSSGAPYTSNSIYTHISISHYGGYYPIYLSNKPVGIDVQIFKDSLLKGKHYFVNDDEESNIELTQTNLHLIWAAKEAFYKKKSGEINDLKNEVSIIEIDEVGKLIRLKYQKEVFVLNFAVFDAHVITWA